MLLIFDLNNYEVQVCRDMNAFSNTQRVCAIITTLIWCNIISIYPLQEPICEFKKFHQSFRHLKVNKSLTDSFSLHLNIWLTYLRGWTSLAFPAVRLQATTSRIIIFSYTIVIMVIFLFRCKFTLDIFMSIWKNKKKRTVPLT